MVILRSMNTTNFYIHLFGLNGHLNKYIISILLACITIFSTTLSVGISAHSPSFITQQIINPSKSWAIAMPLTQLYYGRSHIPSNVTYLSHCTRIPIPDIIGESYSSDGKNLTDIIWLNNTANPPLQDTTKISNSYPQWETITYKLMIIATDYSYSNGTQYLMTMQWDKSSKKWIQQLEQLQPLPYKSSFHNNHTPESIILQRNPVSPNFTNADITSFGGSHVNISVNLDRIGGPQNFIVDSGLYLSFNTPDTDNVCDLSEVTPWVPLPPPKVYLYTNPKSITLMPNTVDNDVQIHVNSSVALPSLVQLYADLSNAKGALNSSDIKFTPPTISLSSISPKGTSTLHINASKRIIEIAKGNSEFLLPIKGSTSFKMRTVNAQNGVYLNNSQPQPLSTDTFVEVTIKKAPDMMTIIGSWFQVITINAPVIQAIVAVGTTIAGAITSIVIFLQRKRDRESRIKEQDQEKSGSPF